MGPFMGRRRGLRTRRDLLLIAANPGATHADPVLILAARHRAVAKGRAGSRRVEREGKGDHLTLNSVCRSAGVPPNLLTQWKSGSARVTGTTFGYHVGKVARQLEAEEDALREYLGGKRAGRARDDGGRAHQALARAAQGATAALRAAPSARPGARGSAQRVAAD